jgi:hypothetical protein
MSDRKYRHRGYQDSGGNRDRDRDRPAPPPRDPRDKPIGPKTPNLMASQEIFRCRCGQPLDSAVGADDRCGRCGGDVHSCVNCVSFDPGSPLECMQTIRVRVSPKDAKNSCTLFAPRTTVERQTSSPRQSSARQAFDDLFKF